MTGEWVAAAVARARARRRASHGPRGVSRGGAAAAHGMLRLCCCPRRAAGVVTPSPGATTAPARRPADLKLDLVADLPPLAWDSSVSAAYDEKYSKEIATEATGITQDDGDDEVASKAIASATADDDELPAPAPPVPRPRSPASRRSPSICVEDYSERSNPSLVIVGPPEESPVRSEAARSGDTESLESEASERSGTPGRRTPCGKSTVENVRAGESGSASARSSGRTTPSGDGGARTPPTALPPPPPPVESPSRAPRGTRDVRTALAECIVPARHEDWEAILAGLIETERLAADLEARASPSAWRAAARAAAAHVRSLRSRVARAACLALGALYEHRGRALEPELEEAAAALLDRCADANRFLRADAAEALGRVACGGSSARAAAALCRRGAAHRAGPVRAAAAAALARLVAREGAGRALALPAESRALLLRSAGELLGDASAEARQHARALCLALSEDARFRPLLKEAMPPTRYRSVEKLVDKLRYR